MCASKPPTPQAPPPTPEVPRLASRDVQDAGERERRRRRFASGRSSTLLTGARGVTSQANTGNKVLLGG